MAENCTGEDIREALGPIASLTSKSEKARTKLTPGTWQHTMLSGNLKALRLASALLDEATGAAGDSNACGSAELQEALCAFKSMIDRTEKTRRKFTPGTSQHTLQKNRLRALRTAEALITQAWEDKSNA